MCAEHRGERRRLADAGGAGDEDQPAVLLGQPLDAGGQAQALEVGHLAGDDAERERDLAALAERVDAEARQAVGLVGGVELAGLLEGGEPRPRRGADEREHSSSAGGSSGRTWIGSSSPSRRTIGGRPTLRWTSLAPASTTRRSRLFRSMSRQTPRCRCDMAHVSRLRSSAATRSCGLGGSLMIPPPPEGAKRIGGKIKSLLWPANTRVVDADHRPLHSRGRVGRRSRGSRSARPGSPTLFRWIPSPGSKLLPAPARRRRRRDRRRRSRARD